VAEKASCGLENRGLKLGIIWKTKRKSAKLLLTSFAYFSISYLFYGADPLGEVAAVTNF
jgi:hypothetical protein